MPGRSSGALYRGVELRDVEIGRDRSSDLTGRVAKRLDIRVEDPNCSIGQ